jgi:hypothetical protein
VATAIGLTLLTIIGFGEFGQFTLVLALIAGVLEWFPIIGPIIAAVPAILIGLSIGFPAAVAAALLYIAIQQLENNLLVPKVLGDAIELHPAVMILSLVVGGALFGIGGAILAAPTVAAGRDLYRYGFHRFGGQPPALALELAFHGAPEEAPGPPADKPPPTEEPAKKRPTTEEPAQKQPAPEASDSPGQEGAAAERPAQASPSGGSSAISREARLLRPRGDPPGHETAD